MANSYCLFLSITLVPLSSQICSIFVRCSIRKALTPLNHRKVCFLQLQHPCCLLCWARSPWHSVLGLNSILTLAMSPVLRPPGPTTWPGSWVVGRLPGKFCSLVNHGPRDGHVTAASVLLPPVIVIVFGVQVFTPVGGPMMYREVWELPGGLCSQFREPSFDP